MQILKTATLILVFLLGSYVLHAQFKYLGLAKESNIRKAQKVLGSSAAYWPKSKIIGDYIYVCTIDGIYRKDLRINDTNWIHYAFQGVPVRDFIRKNDSLVCITTNIKDSLLLLSTDNGATYKNYTSPFFFNNDTVNTVYSFAQNPQNPNSIIGVQYNIGIMRSYDFGYSWDTLKGWRGGYQEWYVGYNALDTTSLYYTGEQMFFESYIQVSNDDGKTWSKTGNIHNHCTHVLTTHPTDTNIMISGGEGLLGKSYDRGRTWTYVDTLPIYIFSMIYDTRSPKIAYAVGDLHGQNDTLKVFYSRDGGTKWDMLYKQQVDSADGQIQVHQYKNKLVLHTFTTGIFMLDIDTVAGINDVTDNVGFPVYPNPTSGNLTIECDKQISKATLTDMTGKKVALNAQDINRMGTVDIAWLSKGLYVLTLELANHKTMSQIIQLK